MATQAPPEDTVSDFDKLIAHRSPLVGSQPSAPSPLQTPQASSPSQPSNSDFDKLIARRNPPPPPPPTPPPGGWGAGGGNFAWDGRTPLTVDVLKPLFVAQESSGNYTAVNAQTGALGRYQVMPGTGKRIAERLGMEWHPELMRYDTVSGRAYQDRIGTQAIQDVINQGGGNPARIFSAYYSGSPTAYLNPAGNPKTAQYVQDMMARLRGGGGGRAAASPQQQQQQGSFGHIPVPTSGSSFSHIPVPTTPAAAPQEGFWNRIGTTLKGGAEEIAAAGMQAFARGADLFGQNMALADTEGFGTMPAPEVGKGPRSQIGVSHELRKAVAPTVKGLEEAAQRDTVADAGWGLKALRGGTVMTGLALTSIANPAAGAGLFYSMGYDQAYNEAKAKHLSDEEANEAGNVLGGIQAALSIVPFGSAISRGAGMVLNQYGKRAAAKYVAEQLAKKGVDVTFAEVLGTATKAGAENLAGKLARFGVSVTGQAGVQIADKGAARFVVNQANLFTSNATMGIAMAVSGNAVAQQYYDPDRPLFEHAMETALEFALGGHVAHAAGWAGGKAFDALKRSPLAETEAKAKPGAEGPPPSDSDYKDTTAPVPHKFEAGDRVTIRSLEGEHEITEVNKSGKSVKVEGRDGWIPLTKVSHNDVVDPTTGRPVANADGQFYAAPELKERAAALGIKHPANITHEDLLAQVVIHEADQGKPSDEQADRHEVNVDSLLTPNELGELDRSVAAEQGAGEGSAAAAAKDEATGAEAADTEGAGDAAGRGQGAAEAGLKGEASAAAAAAEPQTKEEMHAASAERAAQLGLTDKFVTDLVDTIDRPGGGKAEGSYRKKVIQIAMDLPGKIGTLNHEIMHFLREAGVFTDAQWAALVRTAKAQDGLWSDIQKRYPREEWTREEQEEELVADFFKKVASGDIKPSPVGASLFARFVHFMRSIRDRAAHAGFTTADEVMRYIESGEAGKKVEPLAEATPLDIKAAEAEPAKTEPTAANAAADEAAPEALTITSTKRTTTPGEGQRTHATLSDGTTAVIYKDKDSDTWRIDISESGLPREADEHYGSDYLTGGNKTEALEALPAKVERLRERAEVVKAERAKTKAAAAKKAKAAPAKKPAAKKAAPAAKAPTPKPEAKPTGDWTVESIAEAVAEQRWRTKAMPKDAADFYDANTDAIQKELERLDIAKNGEPMSEVATAAPEKDFPRPTTPDEKKTVEVFDGMVKDSQTEQKRADVAKMDKDTAMQEAILQRATWAPIPDGDIIHHASTRWAYENGYLDMIVTGKDQSRYGVLNEAGAKKLNELRGRATKEMAEADTKFSIPEEENGRPTRNSAGRMIALTKKGRDNFWAWFGDSIVKLKGTGEPLQLYHMTTVVRGEEHGPLAPYPRMVAPGPFEEFRTAPHDIGFHFGPKGQGNDLMAQKLEGARDPEVALEGQQSIPVYLKIANPLQIRDAGSWTPDIMRITLPEVFPDDIARIKELETTKDVIDYIKSKGHDGVVYKNNIEVEGMTEARKREREAVAAFGKYMTAQGRKTGDVTPRDYHSPEAQAMREARAEYKEWAAKYAEDSYIAFEPEQVKSAIGNTGEFNPADPRMRYSVPEEGEDIRSALKGVSKHLTTVDAFIDKAGKLFVRTPPGYVHDQKMIDALARFGAEPTSGYPTAKDYPLSKDEIDGLRPEQRSTAGEHLGERDRLPAVGGEAGAEGAAGSRSLTEPPVRPDGTIKLDHWTSEPGLTETDPARWGQSGKFLPAAERIRRGVAPPRTYFGIGYREGGYAGEFPRRQHPATGEVSYAHPITKQPVERVEASIPADRVYDMDRDPDGLKQQGQALERDEQGNYLYNGKPMDGASLYEHLIKDAGYEGYWTNHPELGLVAATFSPVEVSRVPKERYSIPDDPTRTDRGETTKVRMPTRLARMMQHANDNTFAKGRDFKVALQRIALSAQRASGINLRELTPKNAERISDFIVDDALEAVKNNADAIGWYDRKVTGAMEIMSEAYPELKTDPESRFAFIFALAVTSNGIKVNKNFELAADAYDYWKEHGEFPTNIGIGEAKAAINKSLGDFKKLKAHFGSWEALRDFMVAEHPVRDVERMSGFKISGEGKGETVRGAAVLGPKIGNGFFSNLYGHFDGLTMDRWLMRSVGRWRGSLIGRNLKMEAQKRVEIREIVDGMGDNARSFIQGLIGRSVQLKAGMSDTTIDKLGKKVAELSADKGWRERINDHPDGEGLRLASRALAKYLDAQVEAPAGANERKFLRSAFKQALARLQQKPGMENITMADLQALLWYPEKLLYDSARKPAGEQVTGYAAEEAPDYENAARALVAKRLGRGPGGDGAGSGGTPPAEPAGRDAAAPEGEAAPVKYSIPEEETRQTGREMIEELRGEAFDRAWDRAHAVASGELAPLRGKVPIVAIRKAMADVHDGKITESQFQLRMKSLLRGMEEVAYEKQLRPRPDRQRGPDFIRQKLLEAKRRGDISEEGSDMAEWFIQQNPRLVDELGISIRRPPEGRRQAGTYDPFSRIASLFKGSTRDTTAVHEMLHHLERMMPTPLQRGIHQEWQRALTNALRTGNTRMRDYVEAVMRASNTGRTADVERAQDLLPNYEAYPLINSSEFFAVNAARIMESRYNAQQAGLGGRLRNWLGETVQKARGLLRLPSDAPMLRALREVMGRESGMREPGVRMLSERQPSDFVKDDGTRYSVPERDDTKYRVEEGRPPEGGIGKKFYDAIGGKLDRGAAKVSQTLGKYMPSGLKEISNDIGMKVAPMREGSSRAQAEAKDFANALRLASYQWGKVREWTSKNFTPEDRKLMWEAADEEGVLRRQGKTPGPDEGLNRLDDKQRDVVTELQGRAQRLFEEAKRLKMTTAEGLESYVPRMLMKTGADGRKVAQADSGGEYGSNLTTTTGQFKQRKHDTVEATEAAMKEKFGAGASVIRDINTLALAAERMERAIAGRILVNKIKEVGKEMGTRTVVEGDEAEPNNPGDYFTIPGHPALQKMVPQKYVKDDYGKMVPLKDENGETIVKSVPLRIHKDFEGPLKAVLTTKSGATARALMDLKGKMMGVIMYSPMIHNMVIWGKALPAMIRLSGYGKHIPADVLGLATFKMYRNGHKLKSDPALMKEAISAGMVPIAGRHNQQDVGVGGEGQDLGVGQSWTAQTAGFITGLFSKDAKLPTKQFVDKVGEFWHNRLLWDQIGALQASIYVKTRDSLKENGADDQTAQRFAAHYANRYAGAMPAEALSKNASTVANLALFSRSFTLGNIGTYKDVVGGLPSDVRGQILRDAGPQTLTTVQGRARAKGAAMLAMDIGLAWVGMQLAMQTVAWVTGNPPQDPKDNEEGKKNRFFIRYDDEGRAVYGRLPTGKVAEELIDWPDHPMDTLQRKLSPYGRLATMAYSDDKGFDQAFFRPDGTWPERAVDAVSKVTGAFLGSMMPEGEMKAMGELFNDRVKDKTAAAMTALSPATGITISHGARGGPAMADVYAVNQRVEYYFNEAKPEIRNLILDGDIPAARKQMTEIGVERGLQNWFIKVSKNPKLRMSKSQLRKFHAGATPEEVEQFGEHRAQAEAMGQ